LAFSVSQKSSIICGTSATKVTEDILKSYFGDQHVIVTFLQIILRKEAKKNYSLTDKA
jgi:hypothetical protein